LKIKKLYKRIFLLFALLGFLFLHFYAARFITEIRNPLVEIFRSDYLITTSAGFDNNPRNGKYINFTSFDNLTLSCFLTYSNQLPSKGTIILLHGIRSKKEQFIELSEKLSEMGYNSVALDSRAHGSSEGTHCTFGVKEKKDISTLITMLLEQENLSKNIGVWGQSLGGAIGLQALGSDHRIKFGVIESTFSDFRIITNDYIKRIFGINIKPINDYLVYRAGKIADFEPENARPIKYCEQINQPILLVHGLKDERINIKYGYENYFKIPSNEKQFIAVESANHTNVWKIGGQEYFNQVMAFIDGNTDEFGNE
tara:strand:- start:4866 stop:5801 length:936 start_codon:yes stop_codon:yes gene_type:complete